MKKTLIGLMIVVMTLSGCSFNGGMEERETINDLSGSTTNQPVEKRVVKIGVIAPLSGPGSTYGEDMVNVTKLVIDKFNANQTGIKIDLIIEDGKCNGADATSAVRKLIDVDKVNFLIPGACSSEALSAGKIANQRKIFSIGGVPGAPAISNIGPYLYRFADLSDGVPLLKNYLSGNTIVIYEQTDFAKDVVNRIKTELGDGIEDYVAIPSGEKDLDIVAKNMLKYSSIENLFIVFQSAETNIAFANAMKKNNVLNIINGKVICTGNTFCTSKDFLRLDENITKHFLEACLNQEGYTEEGKKFLDEFDKKFSIKHTPIFIIFQHDAINVFLEGINKGFLDSESMRSFFESINKDNKKVGLLGEYYFENRSVVGLPFAITKIQSGQVVVIE